MYIFVHASGRQPHPQPSPLSSLAPRLALGLKSNGKFIGWRFRIS